MKAPSKEQVAITPPKFEVIAFPVKGTAPYVQLRFSHKAMKQMQDKMERGSQAKKGMKREPRDFDADYKGSMYQSTKGWRGIPAASIRAALISSCKIVGFQMTRAKLALFVIADGVDAEDGTPLVKIAGEPRRLDSHVRNATGVADIRVRAQWIEWSATFKIRFDADMFSKEDVTNLIARAGLQVGIGEGRPDSKQSNGMGWGLFESDGAAA